MSLITITLPDGASRQYEAGITGADVAADISKSLAKAAIACTVNGEFRDLSRPIEADASLALHTMSSAERRVGKECRSRWSPDH